MKKTHILALSVAGACALGVCVAPLMIAARSGAGARTPLSAPLSALASASDAVSAVASEGVASLVEAASGTKSGTRSGSGAGRSVSRARGAGQEKGGAAREVERPRYDMSLDLDWRLLSFRAEGQVDVPVRQGDSLSEAVLFVFANAGGVGGADASHANISIDSIALNGAPVPWRLDGAVLRVQMPQPQTRAFALRMNWHGVIPRLPPSDGGIGDLMGAGGADIDAILGGVLGGGAGATPGAKPAPPKRQENTDFGLYAYGNGVASMGAFWYPTLAVRQDGRWIDEAPRGLGDVSYAEESDYRVSIQTPPQVLVAAPGEEATGPNGARTWTAQGVRDFAILASDTFMRQSRNFDVGGRSVRVEAFTTRAHAAKSGQAIDIAGRALQIFARRFGPYAHDRFAVVEGPLRGGAGGMEYSGMTAIASALYGDLSAQLGALTGLGAGSLGDGALGGLLGDIEREAYGDGGGTQGGTQPRASGNANAGAPGEDVLGGLAGAGGMGAAGDLLKQQGVLLNSMFEATIAHETAHQWWAIGVGSDSQRAPWVDESLTNWSAMLYFEDRYSRERSAQMMEAHLKTAYAMARMLGSADDRADKRTSDYSNNIQYGAMIYGKGALFYARLRELMGDEAFFGALRKYFAAHDGRLANGPALLEAFRSQSPGQAREIDALFGRWIQGTHGDEDITGGAPPSLADMLGGAMGGAGALGTE